MLIGGFSSCLFTHSFFHWFIYLLKNYCIPAIPGTVSGVGDLRDIGAVLTWSFSVVGKNSNRQILKELRFR